MPVCKTIYQFMAQAAGVWSVAVKRSTGNDLVATISVCVCGFVFVCRSQIFRSGLNAQLND